MSDMARRLYACASVVCLLVVVVLLTIEAVQSIRYQKQSEALCIAHGMYYEGTTWNLADGQIVLCKLPFTEVTNGPGKKL